MDRQLQIVLRLQDQASAELNKILNNLGGIDKGTQGVATSFDAATQSIIRMAGAYLSFRTIYNGLSLGLQVAADLQTAEIGIKTLTGSADDAAQTIARIKVEAMRTPFEINGLAQAVQLMASVTHDGGKATDLVLNVGEALAALGKGQPELDRIMINFQQIGALGHAQGIDIKQFAFAGIPIYEMLAKQTGLAGDALDDFIKHHGVTFDLLSQMFDKANDKGGQFFEAYKNQLGTFNQALSNMRDSIHIALSNIVKDSGLFDGITKAMLNLSTIMQEHPKLAEGVFILVGALAALVGVLSSLAIIAPLVEAGLVMMSGPIGLMLIAVALLGIILFAFRDQVIAFMFEVEAHTGILSKFKQAWDDLSTAFTTQLEPALLKLWVALQPLMPYIEKFATLIGVVLLLALTLAIKLLTEFITHIANLVTAITPTVTWITTHLTPVINGIGDAFQYVIDKVNALIASFSKLTGIKAPGLSVGGIMTTALGAAGLPIPFADGGIVTSPTLGLVGEAGPEAIIPLSKMGSMGGITVNVYGDVTGNDLIERVKEGLMTALGSNVRLAI